MFFLSRSTFIARRAGPARKGFTPPARHGFGVLLAVLVAALSGGCASTITAQVSSFQQWPADAPGSRFNFVAPQVPGQELEHTAYAGMVTEALVRQGLQPASPGQAARFLVDLRPSQQLKNRQVLRPIYQDRYVYRPGFRDASGRFFPGFWGPDPFGPRYVGDQQLVQTVQVSSLHLRLLDQQGPAGNVPRTVFESTATHEGSPGPLPAVMPYLVRAVFDDFPGGSGQVRVLRMKADTGEVIRPRGLLRAP